MKRWICNLYDGMKLLQREEYSIEVDEHEIVRRLTKYLRERHDNYDDQIPISRSFSKQGLTIQIGHNPFFSVVLAE